MTKDEMKDKISMALKDPILQMGFEVICSKLSRLEKENAELTCKMKRNTFCYSCVNATERCFRNEIGCPCEKYKSYKGLNKQLTKAKEILTKWVELFKPKGGNIPPTPIQVETEQFLRELEE